MASEMRTFVTVHSENPQVAERLKELFSPKEGKFETTAIDIINKVHNTSYCYKDEKEDYNQEVDFPPNELWDEMIGTKWLYVDFVESDTAESCDISIRSAYSVPVQLLEFLKSDLQKIDEKCYISGTYEDETYDPSGAFVYGAYDFEEMEDQDEVYDHDEAEEDEFYEETWHDQLNEMKQNLIDLYFEFLEDKEGETE
jgi:hypothetical protein